MNMRRKTVAFVCTISLFLTVGLTGCVNTQTESSRYTSETFNISDSSRSEHEQNIYDEVAYSIVTDIDQYGDVMFDIKEIALEYGDSVDISFSGGYELKNIPYYPDFFGNRGSAILTDHFDNVCVAGIGCSFNNKADIKTGEKVRVVINEKGRYKKEYEAYNINDAKTRSDGQSDESFLNAREVNAGQIKTNLLFRSASPFDNKFGRVELMKKYLYEHEINCILDLSDTEEKLYSYNDLPDYTVSLISSEKVILCPIGVDYLETEAMQMLGKGFTAMANTDGPYLIQCNLGRDRTGVICAVLEALCGASYQEIVDDYMLSYDMLHSIDMDPSSLQYKLFKQRIDEQLEVILGIGINQLPESNLQSPAYDYLLRCGMQKNDIEILIKKLTSSE